MSTEGKIAYIAVTTGGKELAIKLRCLMGEGDIYLTSKVYESLKEAGNTEELLTQEKIYQVEGKLSDHAKTLFEDYEYLIFIMATGIVVRVIAPYVASKFKDPAVIVLDEKGHNVISLLSGHMGGANEMAYKMSRLLKAHPVITTATDVNEKAALDEIIKKLDAYVDRMRESVKVVNYGLVNGEKIGLYIASDDKVDERGFIRLDHITEEKELQEQLSKLDQVVYIGYEQKMPVTHSKLVKVVPRRFVLGVGCKKNMSTEHMLESFNQFMKKHDLDQHSIALIGSIELKKDETAIIALSESLEVPFKVVSKEQIEEVEHLFEGSSFVKKNVGVTCVAEPSAYLLGSGEVMILKEKYDGITFSLGKI